ncbi:MAG: YlbF family regulator [Lachnospiraceae bacterium]
MTNLDEAVEHLLTVIKETDEYQEYCIQREKVSKFPELKAQVDDFRRRNFQLQNSTDSNDLFDRIEAFQQEKEDLIEDPLINDFLTAELNFCRMMQDVNLRITDGLDFT